MFKVLCVSMFTVVIISLQVVSAIDQVGIFKNETQYSIRTLTTTGGAPVDIKHAGSVLNTNLVTNEFLMETLAHFVREKIPERVVHAKGTGAFGYFVTTHDISHICKATVFSEVGQKTPVAARFSVGLIGQGGPDVTQTSMGFAVKFYTKQGNFDILGLNTPMFGFKDPTKFVPFIHAFKRSPKTNLEDLNMQWDFLTLHPESLYMFMLILGDRGIPDGYRHMPGYGIHTYEVYNEIGRKSFVRFHLLPVIGIKYLNISKIANIGDSDLDYFTRDLYKAIGNGESPRWNVKIQILSEEDVKNASFDVFDTSKILPEDQYPLHSVGDIVLNRNPTNYFAEIEQLAFNPGNLVPGILGSPDKIFEARLMSYRQAQAYRLGVNFNKIKVNCPFKIRAYTYHRDGEAPVSNNGYDSPNYYPNSFNGPIPYIDKNRPTLSQIYQDEANNIEQAQKFYTNQMSTGERDRFVQSIIKSLCYTTNVIQNRAVEVYSKIHSDLGKRLAKALEVNQCKH